MYALVKCALVIFAAVAASGFNLEVSDVSFHLFTRSNPAASQPLQPQWSSIAASHFSPSRPTMFTIHNFGDDVASNFNAFVVPAILNRDDVNVIAVDWSSGSAMYSIGLANAPQSGGFIASFINILVSDFGYNPQHITIVGHGLGAHVGGIAARETNGDVGRIFALDPSFHGWTHHPDILSPNAANVVEVIHTTAGSLGYDRPLGHLDFYPNGGRQQVGCGADITCSHTFAYVFFAESLTSEVVQGPRFVGTACEDYQQALVFQCDGERGTVFGGLQDKSGQTGIYSFQTNLAPPFARD